MNDDFNNPFLVDTQGAVLVEGIENWISGLVPVCELADDESGMFLRVKDNKTGAIFLIKRVE